MDNKFLENRMSQIGRFLNEFLKLPQVADDKLTLPYFVSKASDQDSMDKIINLKDMIKKGKS